MQPAKQFFVYVFTLMGFTIGAQPSYFESRGVGGGGALFSPSINPQNPAEFYISCDMSELFKTSNFGMNFSQVHFTQFTGGHNSKVCFTSTTGLLYSISYINDIGTPVKSTDNGLTWTTLTGNPDDFEEVYTIHVDHATPGRVIISHYDQIYFSSNGGNSFTSIHTAATGNGNVVAGVFFDGLNIYIGTNDGVLVSTNGGTSFNMSPITGIPAGDAIWSFCAGKSGGTTRFFCLTADAGDVYVGLQGSDYWDFMTGVYACDFGSTNWVAKMSGINIGTDFPMFIGMAENNIDVAYLSGSNDNTEPIVMKTVNGGTSWSHTFMTSNNQNIFTGWSGDGGDRGWGYGECPFGMSVCATNPDYVVIGDFGFPHGTSDGGGTWRQMYVDTDDQHATNTNTPQGNSYHSAGIENTTCWQVFWPGNNKMWACFSDIRGVRSEDNGVSWSFDYTGHTANTSYRVAQNTAGILFAGTSGIHDMYQSTRLQDAILDGADPNGKIIYSTDSGATWQNLHTFGHPVFWIEIDPANPNRAYASVIHYAGGSGIGNVYRCDDLNNLASSTWTQLPSPPRTQRHPACLKVLDDGKLLATYSGRRDGSGTFTASSGVFIYDPVANSWTDVSDPGMHYWTKDIVVDPYDGSQNTWYVGVFSGWGGPPNGLGGLYKTTNRGMSWTKVSGSLLDRVTSCALGWYHNEIFVTTETQGLWRSNDIDEPSPTFQLVQAYPFRQPERICFNPGNQAEMWVTSFGNGMKYTSYLGTGIDENVEVEKLKLYPNPANGQLTVEVHTKGAVGLQIRTILGETLMNATAFDGKNTIDISSLPAGIYLVSVGGKTARLVVQR